MGDGKVCYRKWRPRRKVAGYSRTKGDDFSLRGFFTELFDAGFIPISLIRWEITPLADEVEVLLRWARRRPWTVLGLAARRSLV